MTSCRDQFREVHHDRSGLHILRHIQIFGSTWIQGGVSFLRGLRALVHIHISWCFLRTRWGIIHGALREQIHLRRFIFNISFILSRGFALFVRWRLGFGNGRFHRGLFAFLEDGAHACVTFRRDYGVLKRRILPLRERANSLRILFTFHRDGILHQNRRRIRRYSLTCRDHISGSRLGSRW